MPLMRASALRLALASLSLGLAAAALAQDNNMSQPNQPPVQPFGGLTPPGISTVPAGGAAQAPIGFSTAPVPSSSTGTAGGGSAPGATTPTGAPGTVPPQPGPQFQTPPGPQYQQTGPAFTQPAAPFSPPPPQQGTVTPVTPPTGTPPATPNGTVNPGAPGTTTAPRAPQASMKQQRKALQAEFNRRRTEMTLSDEFKSASRKERKAQLEALKREFLEKEKSLGQSGK